MKCKNIECDNNTKNNNTYCSLTCRNIYVNKHLRDYNKISNRFKNKRELREKEYLKNPKLCKECNEIIPFDRKKNIFCNNSCSATHTNKGKKHSKETLSKMRNSANKRLDENEYERYIDCKNNTCDRKIKKRERKKYCTNECKKEYGRKNMTEYQKYKADANFKFSLNDYPNEFNFDLIREYGWYSPTNKNNNLGGISRDHILSVREGFELGIDPFLLSHPANCRLMIHNENVSKHKRSDLTEEELKEKIKKFNKLYEK